MILFETQNLTIKRLSPADKGHYTALFTDPTILELIPQKPFTAEQITERFTKNLNIKEKDLKHQKADFGIFEKGKPVLIGLALFLINDANEKELGYRFRPPFWGKGYGTETTQGMLDYYFQQMKLHKVTADVNIANTASVKILTKFMQPVGEFFNERDQCTDRRYEVFQKDWKSDY